MKIFCYKLLSLVFLKLIYYGTSLMWQKISIIFYATHMVLLFSLHSDGVHGAPSCPHFCLAYCLQEKGIVLYLLFLLHEPKEGNRWLFLPSRGK